MKALRPAAAGGSRKRVSDLRVHIHTPVAWFTSHSSVTPPATRRGVASTRGPAGRGGRRGGGVWSPGGGDCSDPSVDGGAGRASRSKRFDGSRSDDCRMVAAPPSGGALILFAAQRGAFTGS